ncbi:MAG: hypothetical protein AAF810_19665 [Cyanobacteria bacterium P01_D01_bin.36]
MPKKVGEAASKPTVDEPRPALACLASRMEPWGKVAGIDSDQARR